MQRSVPLRSMPLAARAIVLLFAVITTLGGIAIVTATPRGHSVVVTASDPFGGGSSGGGGASGGW